MTQGIMQGPLDRPVPALTERHWWHRLGDIATILKRMDQRAQDANSFKLAIDEKSPSFIQANQITVPCQTSNPCIITGFIATCSTGSGQITIGDSLIYLTQAQTIATGLSIIRRGKIDSTLVAYGGPTSLYLEVMGYEQPRMAI